MSLTGDLLDEIRALPNENILKIRLQCIEYRANILKQYHYDENNVLILDEELDEQLNLLTLDYLRFKETRLPHSTVNEIGLNKQKEFLKDNILNQHHNNYFYVIDMEAGTGKTKETEKIIATDSNSNQYIFVRPDIKDCESSVECINHIAKKEIAINYNSKKYNNNQSKNEFLDKIHNYKVICISHAKYLDLCKNDNERKVFIQDRNILIIDEYINPVEKVIFNKDIYDDLYKIFSSIKETDCISYLDNIKFSIFTGNTLNTEKNKILNLSHHKLKFMNYLNGFEKALERVNIKSFNKALLSKKKYISIKSMSELKNYIKSLHNLVDNACIYLGDNGIVTYNSDFQLFKLDNNIILNASGILQPLYFLDKKNYVLANLERLYNRSNCTLYHIPINTSKNAKNKHYNNFDKDMVDLLFKDCNCSCDDTLVVGNKEGELVFKDCLIIDDEDYNYAYFGNLVGKNDFRNLKNVAIIQTPNFRYEDYILLYLYIKSGNLTIDELVKLNTDTKTIGKKKIQTNNIFKDSELEDIKKRSIAEQIYQAVTRINRNNNYESNIYIFISDYDIFQLLIEQFNYCNSSVINELINKFSIKKTKFQKQQEQHKNEKEIEFIEFLDSLLKEIASGKISRLKVDTNNNYYVRKKDYYNHSSFIKNVTDFKNAFKTNQNIVKYCKANHINTEKQRITFE